MADPSEPDQPVAGPSRLSPRQPSPRLPLYSEDVTMETKSGVMESGPHSQEAAELLLGFSTIEPRVEEDPPAAIPPPLDPPSPGIPHTYIDPPKLLSERNTFPYTPPDDPPSHVQIESAQPSSPADPSLPPKPRQKRKRAVGTTPHRRTSTDPARPPHFMGEDNEVIRCICGIDEDDGLTIQCESCYAWQHALCFGYADAESAPEIYYCELCAPRSFDGEFARERQVIAKGKRDNRVQDPSLPGVPGEKKPRGKPKRARVGSVHEDPDRPDKDPSPGTMAPPSTKPRRKPGPKPKPKVLPEPAPAPSYTYIPPSTDAEDDYFRVEPWSLEYTPVRDNVVRGREARRVLSRMYREWVDTEEEEIKRRSMGPSGLPSPTETGLIHLSPDLFPLPDFSVLAPPVPPVPLLGSNLDSLGSLTIIKSISPSLSFLPLSYSEATPLAGPYHRPALYGVFSSASITSSSFIGEYRSEVIDSETYRLDPINQYSILGMLKPHVHPIGPPVNLMLDSRGYGSELRFIRSGCHPNVVLRPFLFRATESDAPKLRFGVFASRDISAEEELVLGWTWDDSHLVHSLRSHLHPTILPDGYPGRPLTPPPPSLLDKFESVLTHFLGTFSSCACRTLGNCAIAQMRYLVESRDEAVGEIGKRANLGVLVGATRGWRRGEEEKERVRRWNLLDLENGWERTVRKEMQVEERVVSQRAEELIVDSREHDMEGAGAAPAAESDEVMGSASEAEEEGEDEQEEDVGMVSQPPIPNGLPPPIIAGSSQQSPPTPPRPTSPDAVSTRHSEPASPATSRLSTPPPARNRSSPQLGSSQSGSGEDEQDDEEEDEEAGVDGNESDATTVTVPRSPSDIDMDETDLLRSTSPSPRSKTKLESPSKRQSDPSRPTSSSRKESESSSDSEPDTAPAPVSSRRDPSRPYKISRFRKDGKEDKRFKSRPSAVSPAGSVAPKRQKKRIISSPITEDDTAEVRVNGKHIGEDIAAALFPEVKEVINDEEMNEPRVVNPPTPPPPFIPSHPPKSPTPPPRVPTPPAAEPAKKVSLSEWLRKRNEEKIERDRQMAKAAERAKEGAETSQAEGAVEMKEEVKPDTTQEGQGFNIHDFLPSSRPTSQEATGSYGSTLYDSPRVANLTTPNGAYVPRTEYFPTTTPRNSSYVPRASVSTDSESATRSAYVPRAVSTPVEEPKAPSELPNGHAQEEYGGYLASRAARSVSVTAPICDPGSSSSPEEGTGQDEPSSMPPPLAYREPPPHQQPPSRSYPSASLSPQARTTVLASPSERTSPLPRLPPTGPKAAVAPTGPRGVWPTPVNTTAERSVSGGSNAPTTPITPTAPSGPRGPITHIPVPGMGGRGGFGGRGMFEPRASWRGRHFGTRGAWR